jgi:cytosine/uracil/thiamine/allantoin permease
MPGASRRVVTFATGIIATIAGMFPAIAMQLLDFVALYGMLLMPMGAVIFVDFWLLKKLGLQDEYAARTNSVFNLAAFLTWALTLAACLGAVNYWGAGYMFFVSLPGWFLAVVLYIGLSAMLQRRAAA